MARLAGLPRKPMVKASRGAGRRYRAKDKTVVAADSLSPADADAQWNGGVRPDQLGRGERRRRRRKHNAFSEKARPKDTGRLGS
jgi:hypothetical protein